MLVTYPILAQNWDLLKLTFVSSKPGDNSLDVTQELHVGVPEQGQEACFGEGDSYTRGMKVYTETPGGAFVDVSIEASSPEGSSFTFPGTAVNNSIYVASGLNSVTDKLAHYGIKTVVETAADYGTGSIVIEYWNGSAWASVNGMEVDSSGGYYPHANNYFQQLGSKHIRYNSELASDSWAKNDPMSLGESFYWIRFRIFRSVSSIGSMNSLL